MPTTVEDYQAPRDWAGTTVPGLLEALGQAEQRVARFWLAGARTDAPTASRAELIEDLIAWSTDPNGIDREALENVDRDGWGIGR